MEKTALSQHLATIKRDLLKDFRDEKARHEDHQRRVEEQRLEHLQNEQKRLYQVSGAVDPLQDDPQQQQQRGAHSNSNGLSSYIFALISMLSDGSATAVGKENAAGALNNLAVNNADNKVSIAKEGGIKPLISMLSDGSATAVGKEKAAGTLKRLGGNAEIKARIIQEGFKDF